MSFAATDILDEFVAAAGGRASEREWAWHAWHERPRHVYDSFKAKVERHAARKLRVPRGIPCAQCGSRDTRTGGDTVRLECRACGFVDVPPRRSPQECIALRVVGRRLVEMV